MLKQVRRSFLGVLKRDKLLDSNLDVQVFVG